MNNRLLLLVKSKPWLLPFLYHLPEGAFSPSQLARELGTRTDYVKHCLRIVRRLNLVKHVGGGLYAASREEIKGVLETLGVIKLRSMLVADLGDQYAIIRARRKYVKVARVSRELVERVAVILAQLRRARASEIAERVGHTGREVYRALLVLRAYGRVVKQGDHYTLVDSVEL